MSKYIVYRLKNKDKKEGSWSLRGGSAEKSGVIKAIDYYPHSNSIFVEDNKETSIAPQTVVFRYNDILSDPAVEIVVPIANKVLNDYLQAHPFFNVHYSIHDLEEIALQTNANYDKIDEAFEYIRESDEVKLRAIGLVVIGTEAFTLTFNQCMAKLKENAVKNPDLIIKACSAADFQTRYLVGLAFIHNIIKTNNSNTAIVWNDGTEGTILSIAVGENAVDNLTDFLSNDTDLAYNLIQSMQLKVDAKAADVSNVETLNLKSELFQKDSALSEKDKEIARQNKELEKLRKQLADKNVDSEPVKQNTSESGTNLTGSLNLSKEKEEVKTEITKSAEPGLSYSLEEATKLYFEKFKTEAPSRFKNDVNWLTQKINAPKE